MFLFWLFTAGHWLARCRDNEGTRSIAVTLSMMREYSTFKKPKKLSDKRDKYRVVYITVNDYLDFSLFLIKSFLKSKLNFWHSFVHVPFTLKYIINIVDLFEV